MKAQTLLGALALFGATVYGQVRVKVGCYKSTTGLSVKDVYQWQSFGRCSGNCTGEAVFGIMDSRCFCGNMVPPDSDKVSLDTAQCNVVCPGYDGDQCGTSGYLLVYDAGIAAEIPKATPTASTKTSATTSPDSSSTTLSQETVLVTQPAQSNTAKSKPNTAGIAAGVVIGVLAIVGIVGGVFLFLRSKKRREIEEEHRRNAAVNSFIGSGKPSSSGGASSFNDTRLDPVMAQRRMSDGSIADNQDYSRRILKVTNA